MRLFDTHCHFDAKSPEAAAEILRRARAAGVEKLLAVGGSREMNEGACCAAQCAAQTEGKRKKEEGRGAVEEGRRAEGQLPVVLTAYGYDMDGVDLEGELRLEVELKNGIANLLSPPPDFTSTFPSPAAVGEIGLDYHYYGPETRTAQMQLFAAQLEAARQRDLPVVVHTREAAADTLALLKEIPSRGIIHCFTGTPDEARAYLDLGFYVSVSGIVTFKAAENVRVSARYIPDDRILIETDAPFLAPVPMRGKPNEPGFVRHTCEFLANLRGVSAEDFAELTFANAERALKSR